MASRLQDVLLRGTFALRPLATDVAKGTLYYSTDLGQTDQSDGTNWNTYTDGGGSGGDSVVIKLAAPYFPDLEDIVYEPQIPLPGPAGPPGNSSTVRRTITWVIDGGGVAIVAGARDVVTVPFTCTIKKWRVLSSDDSITSGSIVIDLWKDTYANFPPTIADTITAAAKPTVSAAIKNEDSTLTGWTTAITAGDVIRANVDSASGFTKVRLEVEVE